MKVTGPCSGQSEVYERSHSVHPGRSYKGKNLVWATDVYNVKYCDIQLK